MDIAIEIIGWIGSLAILVAYGLNSYQRLQSDSITFLLLNLTGGILLIVYTIYKNAFASSFINVVWVLIAAAGIIRYFKRSGS